MDDREVIHPLRAQISNLWGVLVLSKALFDRAGDDEVVKLLVSAVHAVGSGCAEGTYIVRDELPRSGELTPGLRIQLRVLPGADGQISAETGSAWCCQLRAAGGPSCYLVISAEAKSSTDEHCLTKALAYRDGAAVHSAARYPGEHAVSEELRRANRELASVNQALTRAVADLERRTRTHESLSKVAATGGAEPEIADVLHAMTGLAVVVEDKFGNLLGWAGDEQPIPRPQSPAGERTELLNRVQRNGRPLRHRDRILALVQPRDEVLGLVTLIDPERRAGQYELFALEDAAVVLAMELSHQRSMAETELRLRRDLLDELLSGTDDDSAIARSAALGHDLHPPHQVLVVSWPGIGNVEKVARAVDQAATRITRTRALLTPRDGKVVLVAPARDGHGAGYDWNELHCLMSAALPCAEGAVGVGRQYVNPSELPRSYTEALRALGIGQTSAGHRAVTAYEDLGFYRMLGGDESNLEVDEFIQEWLGALIDYDATHDYDLVSTLWQYYECGGNYDATAHALLIHRSTLRYRLRRIRELTGHDLGAVDTRLNLHIATRAWRILHGPA